MHKAGFVNIIGNPNVGKSSLMNILVGEKLSIITSKAQTTRHRIHGIVNGENFQIIYSDTPGIIRPYYKLQEAMMKSVNIALTDADIILYITDINDAPDKNKNYIEKLGKTKTPMLLIINKIDLINHEVLAGLTDLWAQFLPKAEIIAASALHRINTEKIFDRFFELLPVHPAYYPKDTLTDRPERFFASEIIRKKILLNYKEEIPYSVEIRIDEFKESAQILRIRSTIYVLRDSQKGIIIGHKGEMLKKVGTEARQEMEQFFGKKIFLELFVKVSKDWRNNEKQLRRFGY
ncbi:MAG: GTPase Era [Bacteroidia bacterium]|nr:GTPase Era [Bacteroidia bacterium]